MEHPSGYVWWVERDKIGLATTSDNGATLHLQLKMGHLILEYLVRS